MTLPDFLSQGRDGIVIYIHCQPRAKKREVVGRHGHALKIRLTSPPVDGKANREAQSLLAQAFDVPRRHVILVRGGQSREKSFLLKGLGIEKAIQRLKHLGLL